MKILIDQLATANEEHVRVARELSKEHEIVYWIRMSDQVPIDASEFPTTVFHNYHDALKGVPPHEVDASVFELWSREEIVSFSAWESELLTMMDKWYPDWPVNKRKDFYYELLRYWGGVLDQFAPDWIIFNAPPHQMFNFVLYALAKSRGIRTILFDYTFRGDRVIWSEDYRLGNPHLMNWREYAHKHASVGFDDLQSEMKEYYRIASDSPNPTPSYLADAQKLHTSWSRLWRRANALKPYVIDGSIFKRAIDRTFKMIRPDLKDVYRMYAREPDFKKHYVYMPLGYQPEATTSPQGGIFVEQILAIKMLSEALPSGWTLYVKEHPGQWLINGGDFNTMRYHGYYESIAALPNVCLVPIGTSTFELTDHAQAVASVTSTAVWEGVIRGKCGLVFGYPWYMHAPGVARVSSVLDCRETFQKIANGFLPEKNELFKYLAVFEQVVFPGSLHAPGNKVKAPGTEEQWVSMYRVIQEAFAKKELA